jgi:hypothetical protein
VARQVVFRPQAEDELLEAQRWYESRAAGPGTDFAQAVDAVVARIAESPLVFPRVHGDTRRAVMSRFPYAILFQVRFRRRFRAGRLRETASFEVAERKTATAHLHRVTRSHTGVKRAAVNKWALGAARCRRGLRAWGIVAVAVANVLPARRDAGTALGRDS